ncbi:hypothetical protein [Frigoribacterium sp. VKM Ac-2836]|uniref:hypothetical protein n=1 Tax=Frigoribacterium sp. VKM Ac-2836 TaxID=2739014 RepID=UPI001566533E|nr:hypothetical protein [Frigoribacterium sp. VKM Ac-2836]NRD26620.1 hypothetical protein [Frigoribacterium sp. VKM Ac-2836]
MSPRTDRTHAAWRAALDELEALVAEADASLPAGEADTATPPTEPRRWTPPTGLGPLPQDLATRASSLAERQRGVIGRLEAARAAVLQHLGAVRTVEASHEPSRPVYLDATG